MTSDVFNVDCMEYMRTLPDKAFQLVIVDPPFRDENDPFQQMRGTSKRRQVSCTGRPSEEFFEELKRVSENQIIWGANNFGFEFKGFVAWNKMITGSPRYSQVEIASLSEGLGTISSYVEIPTQTKEKKPHLTQKPVALYAWLLKNYAPQGGNFRPDVRLWK